MVTATEPDEAMLAELPKHVPANVKTVRACIRGLAAGRGLRAGLRGSGAALDEPGGAVAALVEPGGGARLVRRVPPSWLTRPVDDGVRAARAPFLDSDSGPSPDGTPPGHDMQWPGTELQRPEWFTDIRQRVIGRRLTMSARDYVGQLSTISACPELPAPEREQARSQIMQVLPEAVEIAADIAVHLARRRREQ
jgi:hypothetical protein